jgi:hypothetical protein
MLQTAGKSDNWGENRIVVAGELRKGIERLVG